MSGVVSVGAAVGMTAMAATGVATAGFTMASTFAVMGAVGAVAGAVGKLTGVKELAIGGAALGAVGGIGSLAAGAGMFGAENLAGQAATDAGTWGADVTATAAPAGGYTAGLGADGLGTISAAGGTTDLLTGRGLSADVISSITGAAAPANTLPFPVDHSGNIIPQGGGEGGTLGVTNNPAAGGGLINGPAAIPPGPSPTTAPAMDGNPPISDGPYQASFPTPESPVPIVTLKPGETQPKAPMPAEAETSSWGGILKFMKENPSLTMGGLMAASSFLQGAFNPKTQPEIDALSASAARNTAEAGLINRQMANMSQPVPKATRTRTNTGTGRIDRVKT